MTYGKSYLDSAPLFFDEGRLNVTCYPSDAFVPDCPHTRQLFTITTGWICSQCGQPIKEDEQ